MIQDTPVEDEAPDGPYLLPAAFAQQRLWFLYQLEPWSAAAYNVPLATRLRGSLDVDALTRAFRALVTRHEPLRTSFRLVGGVPHQVIDPAGSVDVELTDLSGESDPEQTAYAAVEHLAAQPFDLTLSPLLRVRLLRLASDDHILVLVAHHTVIDGWSTGILNRELSELYAAFLEDREPELAELQIQYGDYAAWQQEWIDGGGLDTQLAYWKDKLAGAPALLDLPTDRPRPSRQSFRGAILRRQLPLELLDQLKALGDGESATLFMTLLAAYTALLARYSGQDDVVVASPIAGRNRIELEGVIGCLANTIVLRATLEDDPTFIELLRRVRESSLDAFSNQDTPFEKLVEELKPERHLGHNPIAQVLFQLQPAPTGKATLLGLPAERVAHGKTTSKFDLSLFATPGPEGLLVSLEYCTDLFDESTAERILSHYAALLEAAVADPGRSISTLPLLGEAERERLLVGWNQTAAPYPSASLHELVSAQAASTPDRIAVACGPEQLTFAELDARSNQLANHLVGLGVGSEQLVAIAVERSAEMLVGLLGIMKAGGAYVPVDPSYPAERVSFMLGNSEAQVVVTQERLVAGLPIDGLKVVCLDRDWPAISAAGADPPSVDVAAEQLAYVIYTSGSTGQPKGVQIPHRALVNFLTAMADRPGLNADDVLVAVTTLSFDIAGLELYLPLLQGARLVVATSRETGDPRRLADLLAASGATVMQATPTTWRMLLDSGWRPEGSLKALCGGEPLPVALADRLLDAGVELWNMYGPTETTIWSACKQLSARGGVLTIGRPIANTTIYILDRHRQPVPIGVAGELWIGGHGLARGYRGRDDLTAERFIPDPFDTTPGARIYLTGDLARYRPDGEIEFLGRIDNQVKVRGFRIELGEIEAALARHPSVREAVVIARGADADAELAAYVIAADPAPSAGELREHAGASLAPYMVPSTVTFLDAFPLTPNGKVDRRALPAPDLGSRATSDYVAPSDGIEQQLAELWMELLEVERVGVDDDFFALGGHSLLAVRLVQMVQDRLGRTCTLTMLFRTRTIRGLAAELHAGGLDVMEPAVLQLQGDDTGTPVFCVCGVHVYQELADALGPDMPVYGMFLPVEQDLFGGDGMDGSASALPTVEQMASAYIDAMREKQPVGPYHIVGFCFGGVVAYEIARQLNASGEAGAVILLDTALQGTFKVPWARTKARQARRRARRLVQLATNPLKRALGRPTSGPTELNRLWQLRNKIFSQAKRRYAVPAYPGPLLLVQSQETLDDPEQEITDPTFGWGRYADRLEIHRVPGGHQTHLQRPYVDTVVNAVRPFLEAHSADRS